MREFTFNQFHGWTSNHIWWWLCQLFTFALAISIIIKHFCSTIDSMVQPAGCIRCIALMQLQIMRYYFPYKETNQSFEFGLWWHPEDSVSYMLLRRLWRLISPGVLHITSQLCLKCIPLALRPVALGIHFRQSPYAHVTTITYHLL